MITGDQNESSSLCPSRKGSVFSVVSSNRPATSITPSTSSHHLQLTSGANSNSNTIGREYQHPKDQRYGSNHHSLDREKIRQSHHHHHHHQHSASSQPPPIPAAPQQQQPMPNSSNNHHHHHHHHRSLDRDSSSNSSKSNAGSASSGGQSRGGHFHSASPGPNMPRSRSSNNSLSNIVAGTADEDLHHLPTGPQHRRTNFDACQTELEATQSALPTPAQSRSSSRAAMQRPPKDPKSSHHHHHHHHNGGGELHRKKSLGPDEMVNGHRKLSAAGSMSSMHSEASASSYANHRKLNESPSGSSRTIQIPPPGSAC